MVKWSSSQMIDRPIQEPLTLAPVATTSGETVNVSAKWTTDGVVLTQSVVRLICSETQIRLMNVFNITTTTWLYTKNTSTPVLNIKSNMHSLTELVQCPELTVNNGAVVVVPSDRLLSSVATYSCSDDYRLRGNRERVCEMDSMWSGTDPLCGKKD